ncbi:MAG: cupin domain-containing protein [archaeon]
MFIRDIKKCEKFKAGDESTFRELFNPRKDDLKVCYSLGEARVKPGQTTRHHKLKSSEVYYILQGKGVIFIDYDEEPVKKGQSIYIPPNKAQKIKNTGKEDLVFLCIVHPAWRPDDEEVD